MECTHHAEGTYLSQIKYQKCFISCVCRLATIDKSKKITILALNQLAKVNHYRYMILLLRRVIFLPKYYRKEDTQIIWRYIYWYYTIKLIVILQKCVFSFIKKNSAFCILSKHEILSAFMYNYKHLIILQRNIFIDIYSVFRASILLTEKKEKN